MACSYFGEPAAAIIIISIIYWCFNKKLGEYLILSLTSAYVVNGIVKIIACVYRPWILDSRIHPVEDAIPGATGYSFPSGHVTTATTLFGGIALKGNVSKAFKILLIICLILVAFSRIYLGVHTLADVVFGFILTFLVMLLFSKLFEKLDENPNLDIIISVIGIVISVLVVIFASTKSYPMDYDALGNLIVDPMIMTIDTFKSVGMAIGVFICWPIERRFINFTVEATAKTRAIRAVFGLIVLLLVMGITLLFEKNIAGGFLQSLLIMIVVVLIYPAIIKFFQNRKS